MHTFITLSIVDDIALSRKLHLEQLNDFTENYDQFRASHLKNWLNLVFIQFKR